MSRKHKIGKAASRRVFLKAGIGLAAAASLPSAAAAQAADGELARLQTQRRFRSGSFEGRGLSTRRCRIWFGEAS